MPEGAHDDQHETGPIEIPPADWLRDQINENRRLEGLPPQVPDMHSPTSSILRNAQQPISLSGELRSRMTERARCIEALESQRFNPPVGDVYGQGWNDVLEKCIAILRGVAGAEE